MAESDYQDAYTTYKPSKLTIGKSHPDGVVETSTLASIPMPDITYSVKLPQKVIETGSVSMLQLEAIVYACQRHELFLPNGQRAGFLIGDGPGVGKGRSLAGIIYENFLNGRKKAIWLSVSPILKFDAERDLADIDAKFIPVARLTDFKYLSLADQKFTEGILFATYASLISRKTNNNSSLSTRLDQLLQWCGPHFDGVIILDECHSAKNLCPPPGTQQSATQTGLAVVRLQEELPKARIVYASATGACEPRNMAYMTRLGLWGKGTTFGDDAALIESVQKRYGLLQQTTSAEFSGLVSMEVVAIEMKMRGLYLARQLSFHGVQFRIEEVPFSDDFKKVYDDSVALWVRALELLGEAANITTDFGVPLAKMQTAYWGAHQRFFKYMCNAAKVDRVLELTRQALKNDKCVVIGLQTTGRSRTEDELQKKQELTGFVSTCKGVFMSLVESHFPAPDEELLLRRKQETAAREGTSLSSDKKTLSTPKLRKNQVVSFNQDKLNRLLASDTDLDEEALDKLTVLCKMKRSLTAEIEDLGARLPPNTLDHLIHQLGGPDCVAEMTGRKHRLLYGEDGKLKYVSRVSKGFDYYNMNKKEGELFMAGKKAVAIISDASSSGISLHNDRRAENEKQRVHITLELPWGADSAVQQFGRTHRSNQRNAPLQIFVISKLSGERRFASCVAKRLESMGALTQADRRANAKTDFSAYNIDTELGGRALDMTLRSIAQEESLLVPLPDWKCCSISQVKQALRSVSLLTQEGDYERHVGGVQRTMSQFLNRTLGMPVDIQGVLFEYFMQNLQFLIIEESRKGNYDTGIINLNIGYSSIQRIQQNRYICKEYSANSATTELIVFEATRGVSWNTALQLAGSSHLSGFYSGTEEGVLNQNIILAVCVQDQPDLENGLYDIFKPNIGLSTKSKTRHQLEKHYTRIPTSEAESPWNRHYNASANICSHKYRTGSCSATDCTTGLRTVKHTLLTGSVLSLWSQVERVISMKKKKLTVTHFVRVEEVDGTKIIGALIPEDCTDVVKEFLENEFLVSNV